LPARILIVDDEPEIGRILAVILRGAGFEVAAVDGGRAALEHLAASTTDLVLLDVTMPELDGFETLRRIREAPATARLPVLMLTANAGAADRARAESLGADDFIAKPFDPAEVVERIHARLRA
jgi:twitching motility two-component system response regulator PilG